MVNSKNYKENINKGDLHRRREVGCVKCRQKWTMKEGFDDMWMSSFVVGLPTSDFVNPGHPGVLSQN